MKRYATGLVVGKFAPLHRGHIKVVEAALAACDRVVVISYSSINFPSCEPAVREGWLAELFPTATRLVVTASWLALLAGKGGLPLTIPEDDAPDDVHRAFVTRLCESVLAVHVDAVFTSEAYGDGFAAYLSHHQRTLDPAPQATVHISVDPDRREYPVSGTALRRDPWRYWSYLAAPVARSLVRRVAFLGGESTGKSTVARLLAEAYGTEHVAEYGRELWDARAGALVYEDLAEIALEQVRREEMAVSHARAYVFCDTSPLTTLFYSQYLFSRVDPLLVELAARRYDYVFLCASDFPFVQDGTRSGIELQVRQQLWYAQELAHRGVVYHDLNGSLEKRVSSVSRILGV